MAEFPSDSRWPKTPGIEQAAKQLTRSIQPKQTGPTTSRSYATTNVRLTECLEILGELISWAEADAEHAAESDAPVTAKNDRLRARLLKHAFDLISRCER